MQFSELTQEGLIVAEGVNRGCGTWAWDFEPGARGQHDVSALNSWWDICYLVEWTFYKEKAKSIWNIANWELQVWALAYLYLNIPSPGFYFRIM